MFYLHSKKAGIALFATFLALIILLCGISLFDTDKTVSEKENRTLATMPEFSISTLFDGSYIDGVETYYSDTFPFRDTFLNINAKVSNVLTKFSAGDDGVVVVNTHKTGDDFAGQSLDDVENAKTQE